MKPCSEADLARVVVEWLQFRGFDVYQEVELVARGIRADIVSHVPLASADSCNVARNIGIDKRWTGSYRPLAEGQRALVLAERIELHAAASRPSRRRGVQMNMDLIG